jgi:GAF domain-containing protein
VYQATIGQVSQTDSIALHHARIEEILKWTKEHLDAYLASAADVIIDQRDEPG